MDHQQDDAYDEENPRDLRGDGGNACRTKNTGDQPDDEKNECVIQHWDTSFSQPSKAEGVPSIFREKNRELIETAPAGCIRSMHLGTARMPRPSGMDLERCDQEAS
jgi:hypothetical protein